MEIKKICEQCREEFEVHFFLKNRRKFCSRKCYLEFAKIPENNPRWKRGEMTKNWLYRKYWVERLSFLKIANICGVSASTICRWMETFEIKRRNISEANKGKIPWNKGMPRTEETKRKLSEANKGKTLSFESKEKIGLKSKKLWMNSKYRKKNKRSTEDNSESS